MLLGETPVAAWAQKIIYSFLIFCMAGAGPLTYSDAFLPDHPHPYHFSLTETPVQHKHYHRRHSTPLPSTMAPTLQINQSWVGRLTVQVQFITAHQGIVSNLVHFFQSGLGNGYLLTVVIVNVPLDSPLFSRISAVMLTGRSASLPPPEKPPSLPLG